MVEYEITQILLEHLRVLKLPKKHWPTSSRWKISKAIHRDVEAKTKALINSSRFLSLSCDEVMSIYNQSWLSLHFYIVRDFGKVLVLPKLEHVTNGVSSDNLTKLILRMLVDNGGLSTNQIQERLLCFGTNGVSILQCTFQLHAPFMQNVHCVSHHSNLMVECLNELDMVARIELLLTLMYTYFAKSSKRHNKLEKLTKLLNSKGDKMPHNVSLARSTYWHQPRESSPSIISYL
jgi:hypothetical protein